MDSNTLLLLNRSRLKEIEAKLSAAYVLLEAHGVPAELLELIGDAYSLTTFAAACNRQIIDNLKEVQHD